MTSIELFDKLNDMIGLGTDEEIWTVVDYILDNFEAKE